MKLSYVAALTFVLVGCEQSAPPSPPPVTAAAPSESPTPLVAAGDVDAGKGIAEACARCHGSDGATSKASAPFLAGQQRDYLVATLRAYRNGERAHEEMKNATQKLSDSDIGNVAAYYASLAAPWRGATPPPAPKVVVLDKKQIALGQARAGSCRSCHGTDGISKKAGVPSLAGLPPDYTIKAMKAYFNGERSDPIMSVFKDALGADDLKHLAVYFASLPRQKSPLPARAEASTKNLATTCNGCHGVDGNSANPAIPSLAGQNAGYLLKALTTYRAKERKDTGMQTATAALHDAQLRALANHYAALDPKAPTTEPPAADAARDPVAAGQHLAASCVACHGEQGNSKIAGTPSLTRLHPDYFTAAVKSYASGQRKHALMKSMVAALTDEDVAALGLYFAVQDPAAPAGKGDDAGEKLSSTCTACHGDKGVSKTPATPTLAGQDAVYLTSALRDYATGMRTHADMKNAASALKPGDIASIAAYFAAQTPAKPDVRLPEPPDAIAQKCDRCHGPDGRGTEPNVPRLSGQVETYLASTLTQYKAETRKSSTMHAMSDVLSETEIKALAAYYARKP